MSGRDTPPVWELVCWPQSQHWLSWPRRQRWLSSPQVQSDKWVARCARKCASVLKSVRISLSFSAHLSELQRGVHIALKKKEKRMTRQGRRRGRLHFLSGNVCVCEAQARGPRVHFFIWVEGGVKREMKGGETGESQQGALTVRGLGRRDRLRLTLRKHQSRDTLKTQDVWFSCFSVSLSALRWPSYHLELSAIRRTARADSSLITRASAELNHLSEPARVRAPRRCESHGGHPVGPGWVGVHSTGSPVDSHLHGPATSSRALQEHPGAAAAAAQFSRLCL